MLLTMGTRVFPSVKARTLTSGALEVFLYDQARAALAEGAVHHGVFDGLDGLLPAHGDDDALAQREAVGLDHDGDGAALDVLERGVRVLEDLVGRRGDAVLLHEALGEDLAALNLGRAPEGAEGGDAGVGQRVDHAEAEGVVRRDDGVVYALLARVGDDAVDVRGGDIGADGVLRDAAVAGQDVYLACARALFERAHNGVLAPAGTYYE